MGRLFGTDGVRGRANADLTPELALSVARAAAGFLADRDGTSRPVAVVGRDPRASGEMLEAAVVAGLASAGAEVLRVGVVPTPALAFLTADHDADLGVMISASHNPMPDNGIKLFSRGGHKLPDALEAAIERIVASGSSDDHRPTGAGVGRVRDLPDAAAEYVAHLLGTVDRPLDGLTVVVDGAHGAAATIAPEVYRQAGATVHAIGDRPDGWNINDGIGSTHLGPLIEAVRVAGADLGLAHDGDADRCLAVTADGELVDGDAILAVCALALHERGLLAKSTVVATVMSNLGFHHTMRDAGIAVHTTAVGDRYVLEALRAEDLSLGGEQSGHLVFLDHATTGDGLLTGLA
ncbi:MAG: phosphoglucosamine mutase, partial [Blastococcus sp.]